MMKKRTDAQLDALARHSIAIRCFLETGDDDYITARLAYRAFLVYPFLWSSLQAIEKYLKAILLLNNISTIGLNHDIKSALQRINQRAPFKITLEKVEQEFFDHIATYGPDRYLSRSYYIHDRELLKLDLLVWHLRQYCRVMNYDVTLTDGATKNMLQNHLDAIARSWKLPTRHGHLQHGKLEQILAKRNHPSRTALVWKNIWYSSSTRKTVRIRSISSAVNAPLSLNPSLLPRIEHLVHVSKEDKKAYIQLWQEMQAQRKAKNDGSTE